MQYKKQTHKYKNFTKQPWWFQYNNDKYIIEIHIYFENNCTKSTTLYLYLLKYIVYSKTNKAKYKSCLLKPIYSKAKEIIKKPEQLGITCIQGY